MRNDVGKVLNSYYACLNGNIPGVRVFQLSVPAEYTGNYIQLRAESESDVSNKHHFVTNPIIVLDIVTKHVGDIDASVVDEIDSQVRELIFPTRRTLGLPDQEDIQILTVRPESSTYIDSFDGKQYIHRKITTFFNRINQL